MINHALSSLSPLLGKLFPRNQLVVPRFSNLTENFILFLLKQSFMNDICDVFSVLYIIKTSHFSIYMLTYGSLWLTISILKCIDCVYVIFLTWFSCALVYHIWFIIILTWTVQVKEEQYMSIGAVSIVKSPNP